MERLKKSLAYVGALLIALLVFGAGFVTRDISANKEMNEWLNSHGIELEDIEVVRTRNRSLMNTLDTYKDQNQVLLDEIASLKSKPSEIEYIVRTETIIQPKYIEVYKTHELPEDFVFRWGNDLAVARFSVEGEPDSPQYEFETGTITIKADLVLAEDDSALSLRASSSLEPDDEKEIPITTLEVTRIREQKLFEPHILLGGFAGMPMHSGFTLSTSLIHPSDKLDLVSIRAGLTESGASIGLDPVLYNIGDRLPVFTNIWIGAGPTFSKDGWAASATIGAKL